MRRTNFVVLTFALFFLAAGVYAQAIPFDVELGYRWTSIDGNEDMYKTQINENDGFLVRSFSMSTGDSLGTNLFDHIRIDASDFGTGPASALTLDVGQADMYRLRLAYRSADHYSALPAFANPLLANGIIPGQHTFDRKRNMFDADLEFLPGRAITPFIGYSYNNNSGPGTTTYHTGLDEFKLNQDLNESDNEYRVGFGFTTKYAYGSVTQGWRKFHSSETFSLVDGGQGGNNTGTVLGQPISMADFTRTSRTEGSTPFTNAYVTLTPIARLEVIGNYVRLNGDLNGDESESSTGAFATFTQNIFYSGLQGTTTSEANNDAWRGGVRAEYSFAKKFDLFAGYLDDHRELSGTALINSIFFDAVTFGGVSQGDLADLINTENSLTRDRKTSEVGVAARAIGPFSLRAAYRMTDEDVDYSPDLAEIVVPGAQGGHYERSIDTFDVNGSYAKSGFLLGAAYRVDSADDPILRTDFLDRDRLRLRAAYATPGQMFRVGVTGEKTNQDNDREGIGYDGSLEQYSADVELAPVAALRLRASYSNYDAESKVTIRRPENFFLTTSENKEDGESMEGGIGLIIKKFTLDAGLGKFENRGTNPFDMNRMRLRAVYDMFAHAGLAAEWDRDKYEEIAGGGLGNFDADRYGLYLRFNR